MPYEPFAPGGRLWDSLFPPHIWMNWRTRLAVWAVLIAVIVGIIAWDAGSMERETRKALAQRLGPATQMKSDPYYRRGVSCGAYAMPSGLRGRFVYVSELSAEDRALVGLHLSADRNFSTIVSQLCPDRWTFPKAGNPRIHFIRLEPERGHGGRSGDGKWLPGTDSNHRPTG